LEDENLASSQIGSRYLDFRAIQQSFASNGIIDLAGVSFFNPCLLAPLAILMAKHPEARVIAPVNENARTYYKFMTEMMKNEYEFDEFERETIAGQSYIRMIKVTKDKVRFNRFSEMLSKSITTDKYGGANAIPYLVGEITDNVLEHSRFNNSWVMIQIYSRRGRMELSVIDDGISIPGSLEAAGFTFTHGDADAINQAVQGRSAKVMEGMRGTGLRTVTNLLVEGMKGELLIVSRGGILSRKHSLLGAEGERLYQTNKHPFPGTLVGMVIPEQESGVDIYDYIE
jgi:hypothetical protein